MTSLTNSLLLSTDKNDQLLKNQLLKNKLKNSLIEKIQDNLYCLTYVELENIFNIIQINQLLHKGQ